MAARRARVLRDQQAGEHPQALRRHLVQVTQHLLAAHGLAGLTTRAIAREAQVSDGVLYNHFADKDDLVVEALTERLGELAARFSAECPRPGEQDLTAGLTAVVRHCLLFQTAAMPLIGGLLIQPHLVHELFARLHTPEGAPRLAWSDIHDYVAGEQALGTISPDVDPETVTGVIFGACHLDAIGALLSGHPADPAAGDPAADGPAADGPAAANRAADDSSADGPSGPPAPDVTRLVAFLVRACA